MWMLWGIALAAAWGGPACGEVETEPPGQEERVPIISGVSPGLAVVAGHTPRSESGIGALMPWADRLWLVSYVAHKKESGTGTGLFEVDEHLRMRKHPASVVGTYANRFVHRESNQLMIGPHLIDAAGNVRTVKALVDHRLAATMAHLTAPKSKA